jgi:hypothetical protein
MQEETKTNWLDELIVRQALPEEIRQGTNAEFCQKWDISESTYYYQASKPENQTKIINLALQNTKKHAPEVLENLAVRAKLNSKDTEMYLKFILQLAEKTDITSGGEKIDFGVIKYADNNSVQVSAEEVPVITTESTG